MPAQRILALSYGVIPILRSQFENDRHHFLMDAMEYINEYAPLDSSDMVAIVGGNFGPVKGASYVELATIQDIVDRNAAAHKE